MGLASLRVCMDSSDWLQGSVHDESGFDSSSPSGGDILTCSRPLMERRLRPPQEQAQKCPRCDSTNTKFCYYNNYSLSQPRYFCKTCRRYWTKGGTLRNIPVGGGCRKNRKVSSKKSNENTPVSSSSHNSSIDLQLSYPEMQCSHIGSALAGGNPHFMLENPTPVDFMESKLEAIVGSSWSNYDLMGSDGDVGMIGELGHHHHGLTTPINNVHNLCSPIGTSVDENGGTFIDTCQRLMLPYDHQDQNGMMDMKPNAKLLALDWQDQGYLGSTGSSWGGMMNCYGSSAANSLI